MTFVTDLITYNVNTRGRKARGVDRHFDTVSLARMINGPAVQEQVKHGDMLGYFGHWPRMKFGMQPVEGGIVDGKTVNLPLAIRTVELSATDAGAISHRTEFLDTEAGIAARALFDSKAGGFSSAIVPVQGTMPMIPKGFYGFDFVFEPNYTTNRGHKVVLDNIGAGMAAVIDSVLAQAAQAEGEMAMLFDSLHAQHLITLDAMTNLSRDNEWLMNRLAAKTGISRDQLLDGIREDDSAGASRMRGGTLLPNWEQFKEAKLEPLSALPDAPQRTPETSFLKSRYGVDI